MRPAERPGASCFRAPGPTHRRLLYTDGVALTPTTGLGVLHLFCRLAPDFDGDALRTAVAGAEADGYQVIPVALLRSQQAILDAAEKLDDDEATGARIVARSVEEPLKQIAVNAGLEGGVVVEKVKSLKGAHGLNAQTGVYEDLFKAGVIDAAKVTRSALQNAASIAALFLTTEAVVVDKPEEKAPASPPGGGMEDY